jgi:hypothetical protein
MPIQTDKAVAMQELLRLSQFDIEPMIGEDELDTILTNAQVCSVWAASTAYSYGDVVVPTCANQNGRRYRCVKAGTSGSTEPTWGHFQMSRTADGSSLIWEEAGAQPKSIWDMRVAAYNAWLAKASKASTDFDFSGAGESYKRSQVYDHCLEMAAKYKPLKIA